MPQIVAASGRSLVRVFAVLRKNIRRFACGEPLLNTLDKAGGH